MLKIMTSLNDSEIRDHKSYQPLLNCPTRIQMFLSLYHRHHLNAAKSHLLLKKLHLRRPMSPSLVRKITEMSEVYVMSAESTQTLCEVQSHREMIKNQAAMMVSPVAKIFRCLVCKSNMNSSSESLLMPCCKSAIFCRACLREWFDSSPNNQSCPHC